MRWKPALNAFAITFNGRITPTGQLTNARVGSTVNQTAPSGSYFFRFSDIATPYS
jgi:hypothetical protein